MTSRRWALISIFSLLPCFHPAWAVNDYKFEGQFVFRYLVPNANGGEAYGARFAYRWFESGLLISPRGSFSVELGAKFRLFEDGVIVPNLWVGVATAAYFPLPGFGVGAMIVPVPAGPFRVGLRADVRSLLNYMGDIGLDNQISLGVSAFL